MFSFRAGLKKKPEEPFLSFVVPLELCVKCYAFVFKSELLRQRNTPYHITVVITNLKKKNPCLRQEKQFFIQQENIQCSIGKGFSVSAKQDAPWHSSNELDSALDFHCFSAQERGFS